jgi:hypothetical protein
LAGEIRIGNYQAAIAIDSHREHIHWRLPEPAMNSFAG